MFDAAIGGEVDGDRGQDAVVGVAAVFDDGILGVVDHIAVVAGAAIQRVRAGAPIQRVVAGQPVERVVAAEGEDQFGCARAGERFAGRRAGGRCHHVLAPDPREDAVGQQPLEIGADALQHDHVDELRPADGAVGVDLDRRAAARGHRLQEIARGRDVHDEPGQHAARRDPVPARQRVEAGDHVKIVETTKRGFAHQVLIDARAAHQGIGAGAGHEGVEAVAAQHQIVAALPEQEVVAGQPAQHIVPAVPGDIVAEGVAGAVDVGGERQPEILEICTQGVGDAAGDGVVLARRALVGDLIADIIDEIGVLALAAIHAVGAGATGEGVVAVIPRQRVVAVVAGQRVVSGIAGDLVGERVAGAVDIAGARDQRQVLKIGGERVVGLAVDLLGAVAGIFADDVAGAVDRVDVVAGAADQRIVAGPAVELVGAGIAGEHVGGAVAGGVEGGRPGQGDVLDVEIGVQVDADRGQDAVVGVVAELDHEVLGVVHHIAVVPIAAVEDVGAGAAVQRIAAVAAEEGVVAGQAEHQVREARAVQGVTELAATVDRHDDSS